jgi:hypothetical protein
MPDEYLSTMRQLPVEVFEREADVIQQGIKFRVYLTEDLFIDWHSFAEEFHFELPEDIPILASFKGIS